MKVIEVIKKRSYLTNVYGVARSLLAIGTLSTLLFNSNTVLFYYGLENSLYIQCNSITSISIFCILKENLILAKVISIIILSVVAVGILPRLTGILHWWITYSVSVSCYIIDGGDQIAAILAFFLIPVTLVDSRWNHWQYDNSQNNYYSSVVAYFSTLMIKIQVAVIYFHAAIGKLYVDEWLNGTALYYWLYSQSFGAPDWIITIVSPLLRSPVFITFLTWFVLALELMLAVSIFYKNIKVKRALFYLGILFHFSILIVHGLFSFFFSMATALIFLLIYPQIKNPNELLKINSYGTRCFNSIFRFFNLVSFSAQKNK